MDALVSMQIESLLVFGLVALVFAFRFLVKQLSLSLYYRSLYQRQLASLTTSTSTKVSTAPSLVMITDAEVLTLSD